MDNVKYNMPKLKTQNLLPTKYRIPFVFCFLAVVVTIIIIAAGLRISFLNDKINVLLQSETPMQHSMSEMKINIGQAAASISRYMRNRTGRNRDKVYAAASNFSQSAEFIVGRSNSAPLKDLIFDIQESFHNLIRLSNKIIENIDTYQKDMILLQEYRKSIYDKVQELKSKIDHTKNTSPNDDETLHDITHGTDLIVLTLYALENNPNQPLQTQFYDVIKHLTFLTQQLRYSTDSPEHSQRYSNILPVLSDFENTSRSLFASLADEQQMFEEFDDKKTRLEYMIDQQLAIILDNTFKHEADSTKQAGQSALLLIFLLATVCLVCGIPLAWIIVRSVCKDENSVLRSRHHLTITRKIADAFLSVKNDEIYPQILHVVLEAFRSKHGYFGYIDENGTLVCPMISTPQDTSCAVTAGVNEAPMCCHLWKEQNKSVRIFKNIHNKQLPQGHVRIENALVAPIIHQGKIIGQLAVADKPHKFTQDDVEFIDAIAGYIAPILALHLENERAEARRCKMETALRDSERNYRLLAENAEDVIWSIDASGQILYISPSSERLFGKPQHTNSSMTGHAFEELLTPQSRPAFHNMIAKLQSQISDSPRKNLADHRAEFEVIGPGLLPVWTESLISVLHEDNTDSLVFLGVTRDITVRKKMESDLGLRLRYEIALLACATNLLSTTAKNTKTTLPQALSLLLDAAELDRVVLYRNQNSSHSFPKAHVILQIKSNRTPGQGQDESMVTDFLYANLDLTIRQTLSEGRRFTLTPAQSGTVGHLFGNTKSGVLCPVFVRNEWYGILAFFDDNRVTAWPESRLRFLTTAAEMVSSFLESRLAEDELKQAKEQAELSDKAKTTFLSTMSHELRTPINGVLGMVELLDTTPLDEEQTEYVDSLRSSSKLLLDLINRILEFSRMASQKEELESSTFSPAFVVKTIASSLSVYADQKQLSLTTELGPNVPETVFGDVGKLHQVLSHLTENAIKFTEKGRIHISVRRIVSTESNFDHQPSSHIQLAFSVADTGLGISEEDQKRILEPFVQAAPLKTRKHGGTGLSLSLAARLVELMNGQLNIASVLGKGSTFTAILDFETMLSTDSPSSVGDLI